MVHSVAIRQRRSISLGWKKWCKRSDPAPYKGCIIFLLALYQLCCSGLEHCRRKMKDGSVWWLVKRGEIWVAGVSERSMVVLVMSSLAQLLVLLCEGTHIYPSHDDVLSGTGNAALLTLSPSSWDQFCSDTLWTRKMHFLPFPGSVVLLLSYLTHMATHIWSRIEQSSLSHVEICIHWKQKHYHLSLPREVAQSLSLQCCDTLLLGCLSSSSLALWKCGKKTVVETMMWVQDLCSLKGRTAMRLGVTSVLVNQMLLMLAGDVEPNPGPGEEKGREERKKRKKGENLGPGDLRAVRNAIYSVRSKWYDIGVELDISYHTLDAIQKDKSDTKDCLTEMLKQWLSNTSHPPTWTGLIQALSSEPVGEKRLAEDMRKQYCYQGNEQATGSASGIAATSGSERGRMGKEEKELENGRKEQKLEEVTNQEAAILSSDSTITLSHPTITPSPCSSSYAIVTSPCIPSSFHLTRYADYLRAVYAKSPVALDRDKWPPTPSKIYIRLALIRNEKMSPKVADHFTRLTLQGDIDQILKAKQEITLEDIMNENGTRLVVVEGAPGIGKSTLAWELCRQWPTMESLKRFSLVIFLRLREEGVRTATAISEFLYHRDTNLCRCVEEEVEKMEGDGVLFVFDGFDEFPAELRKNSLVEKVITGCYLPKSTVLVTSRPSTTAELLSVCQADVDKRIEIVGFCDTEIQEYTESIFGCGSELLASFQTYLSANPMVRGMMYNPLKCGIVIEVYRENYESHRPFPCTQTQLYTELSLCLLSRHLSGTGDSLAKRLPDRLQDIPHDSDLYQQLLSLGKLAFEGRVKDEVIFKQLPEGCTALGLLNTCSELYGRRENVTYHFLHLTLQEYLGAFYISQLSANQQKGYFQQYMYHEEEKLNVMWTFVAGLTRMQAIDWSMFRKHLDMYGDDDLYEGDPLERTESEVEEEGGLPVFDITGYLDLCDSHVVKVSAFIIQCFYEAQDPESCASVFGQSRVVYHGLKNNNSPFDAYELYPKMLGMYTLLGMVPWGHR